MPLYRVTTRERATMKHEYEIAADSPEQARNYVQSGFPDGNWPDSVAHEIDEYTGDIHIHSVTEISPEPEPEEITADGFESLVQDGIANYIDSQGGTPEQWRPVVEGYLRPQYRIVEVNE
jgi:hypothetical protein